MKLYIIRHGESENNVKKCWTGWQDVELTQNGIDDAKSASKYLADVHFDKIYASDLKRACATAENAVPGCEYEKTTLLREINVGNLAGRPIDELKLPSNAELLSQQKDFGYFVFGGESREDFDKRIKAFLDMISASGYQNVAAFSHAGFLQALRNLVLNTKIPSDLMPCRNCAIGVFEYDGSKWILDSWINTKQ